MLKGFMTITQLSRRQIVSLPDTDSFSMLQDFRDELQVS